MHAEQRARAAHAGEVDRADRGLVDAGPGLAAVVARAQEPLVARGDHGRAGEREGLHGAAVVDGERPRVRGVGRAVDLAAGGRGEARVGAGEDDVGRLGAAAGRARARDRRLGGEALPVVVGADRGAVGEHDVADLLGREPGRGERLAAVRLDRGERDAREGLAAVIRAPADAAAAREQRVAVDRLHLAEVLQRAGDQAAPRRAAVVRPEDGAEIADRVAAGAREGEAAHGVALRQRAAPLPAGRADLDAVRAGGRGEQRARAGCLRAR